MGLLLDNSTYRGNAANCNIICHTQQQHICMHCIINQLNIHYLYSISIVFFIICLLRRQHFNSISFFYSVLFFCCLPSFLFHSVCRASKLLLFYFFYYEQFESVSSTLSVLRSKRTELNLASVAILASSSPLECRVGSTGSARERGSQFPCARFQLEVLNMDRSAGRRVQLELCDQLSRTCWRRQFLIFILGMLSLNKLQKFNIKCKALNK